MVSKLELYEWKLKSVCLLFLTEAQDEAFRRKFCNKCTPEMKIKHKFEEEIPGRCFCNLMIKAREKNEMLKKAELKVVLESPYIRDSHFIRKIAKSFYITDKG